MMQNNIKVSVIAPIYGVEKYISRFAESVFSLEYENIEYVFVNDCTKDNSMSLLSETISRYPQRASCIKIINHEENKGLAGARLTGINASTGDYVWLVDSDDYVNVNAINEAMPYMQKGIDLICSNYYSVNNGDVKPVYINKPSASSIITSKTSPSVWKYFIRRTLFFENNIFPIPGINNSEDHVLMSRLALKANEIYYLANSFFYYYDCSNIDSITHIFNSIRVENSAQDGIVVFDYYQEQGRLKEYKRELVTMLTVRLYSVVQKSLEKNNYVEALISRISLLDKFFGWLLKWNAWNPRLIAMLRKLYSKLYLR